MGIAKPFMPHKLFCGLLFSDIGVVEDLLGVLKPRFGDAELRSGSFSFNDTDYYREEMGADILREYIVFSKLIDPGALAEIKLFTNKVEADFADKALGARRVNIDPGLISPAKIMLATTKDYAHRVPLARGIYCEVTLSFKEKSFGPLAWTYPDYKRQLTIDFFNKARNIYMEQLKA